jgi:uroporphyrinogen decarboxylase
MMRQAGRYLPEYRRLQDQYPFFERVQTPELAAAITVQPIERFSPDAAILFSDILVVPQALGLEVRMEPGRGPQLPVTIASPDDILRLEPEGAADRLAYVYRAIERTLELLRGSVPLLGFAGAPFTILCYMVEGGGSKEFTATRRLLMCMPSVAEAALDIITDVTVDYLRRQIASGVHAVQLFDSWGGVLGPDDYAQWSLPYIQRIVAAIRPHAPIIVFAKGATTSLPDLASLQPHGLGIDWTVRADVARAMVGESVTLQGNLDPHVLFAPDDVIQRRTKHMLDQLGCHRTIVNLGHGIQPGTPISGVETFFDTVREYPCNR